MIETSMSMGNTWPEEVRDSFIEKTEQTVAQLEALQEEYLAFGKAYDDGEIS